MKIVSNSNNYSLSLCLNHNFFFFLFKEIHLNNRHQNNIIFNIDQIITKYFFILWQTFALFVAIVGVAVAFPQVPVLTRSEIRDDFGQFALSFNTANGIAVAQRGALKPVQTEHGLDNVLVQQGSYAYLGPDGKLYKLSYIAGEWYFQTL